MSLGHTKHCNWPNPSKTAFDNFDEKSEEMEDQIEVKIIKTELEIDQCWDVAFLLRPHLNRDNWVKMVTEMMQNERYFIAGILNGETVPKAMDLAARAAGIAISRFGAAPSIPLKEEVLSFSFS